MASNRETALITGASGGIGLELAKQFASNGYDLVLVARNQSQLEAIAAELQKNDGVTVTAIAKDLSVPNAADDLVAALRAQTIGVDVLVNNAGFAAYGSFAESEWSQEAQLLQLNIVTLTQLTKLLLPGMVERRKGRILNVASTAAFMPGPLMAVYYASKAYVLSFSEALANELQGSGVTVTTLCPGPTETSFQKRAAMEESKLVKGRKIMDAATVAAAGYAATIAGKHLEIPGWTNRIQALFGRLLPFPTIAQMVRNAQERAGH